jgi:thiamine-phosphate pyrophosphorylase
VYTANNKNYLDTLTNVLTRKPQAVIFREKDLEHDEFLCQAKQSLDLCREQNIPFFINSNLDIARKLGVDSVQVPFELLTQATAKEFKTVAVSVHSTSEAVQAEKLAASLLIAGHIFPTLSKPDLPPRGLDFLREVCNAVNIPVYAIGGITSENAELCIKAGATGICAIRQLTIDN